MSDKRVQEEAPYEKPRRPAGPKPGPANSPVAIAKQQELPPAYSLQPTGVQAVKLMGLDETGGTSPIKSSDGSIAVTIVNQPDPVNDHGELTGLDDDDHVDYVRKTGRSGGQTVYGGVAAGESLVLRGTSDPTAPLGPVDLKEILLSDAAGNPLSAGRFQRSANQLLWHDGAAVRRVTLHSDVAPASPQMLIHNGTIWQPKTLSGGATIDADGVVTITLPPPTPPTLMTNYLLNGGFYLAQRTNPAVPTAIADNAYSADRWRISYENAGATYHRSVPGGLTNPPVAGTYIKTTANGKFLLCQILQSTALQALKNNTGLFQIRLNTNITKNMRMAILRDNAGLGVPAALVAAWNGAGVDPTFSANIDPVPLVVETKAVGAGSFATFSVSAVLPGDFSTLYLMLWSDAQFVVAESLVAAEAGLYIGTGARTWQPRDIQDELALCQHYYQKSYNRDTAPGTATSVGRCGGAYAQEAKQDVIIYNTPLRASMRVAPAVTLYNILGVAGQVTRVLTGGVPVSVVPVTGVNNIGENSFEVHDDAVVDNLGMVYHWTAAAEL